VELTEVWLPVVGHEGLYEVSDLGRIRSVPRTVKTGVAQFSSAATVLKTAKGGRANNYLRVFLTAGRRRHAYVHHLVCEAFHGPKPADRPFVCHRNDCGTDNRAVNLYWGTADDNAFDAWCKAAVDDPVLNALEPAPF
jgi:hypothetical protein